MKRSTSAASALSIAAALLLMASVGRSADAPAKPTGTAVVSGKVTDATGKAAAGVRMSLFPGDATQKPQHAADDPAKPAHPVALATTMTDADGAYKFDALAAGTYTVSAQNKKLGHGVNKVTLTDGQTATVDIQLKKKPGKPNA